MFQIVLYMIYISIVNISIVNIFIQLLKSRLTSRTTQIWFGQYKIKLLLTNKF